jgi:hypothetical protein
MNNLIAKIYLQIDRIAIKGNTNYLEYYKYIDDCILNGNYDNLLQCLFLYYEVDLREIEVANDLKKYWKNKPVVWNDYLKKVLETEGFPIVYDWYDEPNTKYENHKHQGKVSFFVVEGSVTFSGGINKTVSKGERIAQGAFFNFLESDNGNTEDERFGGFGSTGKK